MREFFQKKRFFLIAILLVIFLGAFLRFYHFSDWLHFELDQSRDAKIIDLAIKEGSNQLPLLGPKAAGSFLRLGPSFYYFKYLSALIFGNTPSGMAVIIMIFGILAVPAFYLLARRYFSKWVSFSLLSIFSTSLFLIMYSRFSWNPNALPLFTILTAYCLLRTVDNNEKRGGMWLLFSSFCLAVATQLHFLAFVSLPLVLVLFLIIKRPKIKLAYWFGAVFIILFMNFPVILNEIKTGGGNFGEFKEVVAGKSNKNNEKTLIEKVFKNYTENSSGHFLILSAQNSDLPKLEKKEKFDIKCEQICREKFPLGVASVLLFSLGVLLVVKNLIFEKDSKRKDFVILIFVWFAVAFGLFVPLSFNISPRFWLLTSALPFIFLGFSFELLRKITPKKFSIILGILIVLALCGSNLYQTYKRFDGLSKASTQGVVISADRILKERHFVTLEQQYRIVDYIESFYKKNNHPVYLNSDPFYRRSLLFHLDMKNIPRDDFRNVTNSKKVYRNGNYFLVYPTNSNLKKELDKYSLMYDEISRKQFGTLVVIQLFPKKEFVTDLEQKIEPKNSKSKSAPGVPKRYTWEEIFDSTEEDEEE